MNEKFCTQDLVDLLAGKHGMGKKDSDAFVKEFFVLVEEALKSDRYVKIKGFGTFKLIDVDSRESVNVNTGERFEIQGHAKISFTPDGALRDTINKPFSHFETVVLNEKTVLEDTLIEDSIEEPEEETEVEMETLPADTVEPIEELEQANLVEQAELVEVFEPIEQVKPLEEICEAVPEESPDFTPEVESVVPIEVADVVLDDVKAELPLKDRLESEELIAQQSEDVQSTHMMKRKRGAKGRSLVTYLVALIVFTLLFCGGAIFWVYCPDIFSTDVNEEIEQPTLPVEPIKEELLADTLVVPVDTVSIITPKEIVEEVKPLGKISNSIKAAKVAPKASAQPAVVKLSKAGNYKVAGVQATHVVVAGETLMRISLRYYGTKALWTYIADFNKKTIKNPDNVPYGTKLKIPQLVKR